MKGRQAAFGKNNSMRLRRRAQKCWCRGRQEDSGNNGGEGQWRKWRRREDGGKIRGKVERTGKQGKGGKGEDSRKIGEKVKTAGEWRAEGKMSALEGSQDGGEMEGAGDGGLCKS
eukprot:349627-Chlamydomonas_euryale.AAC.8